MNPKQLAGERAADYVEDGMILGLGTGSTAYFAIRKLGQRVRDGLKVSGIPTSEQSRAQAQEEGIPLVSFEQVDTVDLTIDGADEVDPAFNLTKGGGGALLREKIVASASAVEIIVIDQSKLRPHLGAFPLPVEVVPFASSRTSRQLEALGCNATLRRNGTEAFLTDNGNYVYDCSFGSISAPAQLESNVESICGVVACGLFVGLADRIVVGLDDGTVRELEEPQPLA
jgi:ribose 5-phosphate isomerase A